MKNLTICFNIVVFCILHLAGYTQDAKVKNVDIDIENNKVYINYDLLSPDSLQKNNIELFFIDSRFTIKLPQKTYGDVGKDITPGLNKRIEWNVFSDDIEIAQKLQPKILVNGIRKGGPRNALLSILMPGLGDYFVANQSDIIFKPYLRTISTLGLIGLGIIAQQKRYDQEIWGYTTDWMYSTREDGTYGLIETTEWSFRGLKTKNWLFENDSEVFLISGITLWVADIIWVFMKGTENEKLKMFSNFSLNSTSQNGVTTFGLTYSF